MTPSPEAPGTSIDATTTSGGATTSVAGGLFALAAGGAFPDRVEVAGGAGVVVDNVDPYRHTFVVEDSDVHVELPGSTMRRVPMDLEPGEYRYLCDVPGHEGMEGVLVVR